MSLRASFKKQLVSIVLATVSFIVALAWNQFFVVWIGAKKKERNVNFSFLYAFLATLIGVAVAALVYYQVEMNGKDVKT